MKLFAIALALALVVLALGGGLAANPKIRPNEINWTVPMASLLDMGNYGMSNVGNATMIKALNMQATGTDNSQRNINFYSNGNLYGRLGVQYDVVGSVGMAFFAGPANAITEKMRVTSHGLGINTSNGVELVDIKTGPGGFKRAAVIGPKTSVDGDGAYLQFTTAATDGYGPEIGGLRTGGGGLGAIVMKTGGNAPKERVRVNDNGTVNIGTTVYPAGLYVTGPVTGGAAHFQDTNVSGNLEVGNASGNLGWNIVYEGDSITRGNHVTPSSDRFVNLSANILEADSWYNAGWSGDNTSQMLSQATSQVDSRYSGTYRYNVAVFLGGANDLVQHATQEQIYDNTTAWCTGRQSTGFRVVIQTILPSTLYTVGNGLEPKRLWINSQIRANWPNFADGLADIGNDTLLQDTTTYYSDGLHPNNAGNAIMADYIVAAASGLQTETTSPARMSNLPVFENNTAALAGGLSNGDLYRCDAGYDRLCAVHSA